MSLEQSIAELTQAVRDLQAAFESVATFVSEPNAAAGAPPKKARGGKKAAPAAAPEAAPQAATVGQTAGPVAGAPVNAGAPAPLTPAPQFITQTPTPAAQQAAPVQASLSAEDVRAKAAAVARVLGVNANRIQILLQRFGTDRLSALSQESYGTFFQALEWLEQGGDPSLSMPA